MLFDYFRGKLEAILSSAHITKNDEFIIYPILLMLSRLTPSFYMLEEADAET